MVMSKGDEARDLDKDITAGLDRADDSQIEDIGIVGRGGWRSAASWSTASSRGQLSAFERLAWQQYWNAYVVLVLYSSEA